MDGTEQQVVLVQVRLFIKSVLVDLCFNIAGAELSDKNLIVGPKRLICHRCLLLVLLMSV